MNDKSIRDQSNAPRIDAEEILAGVLEWVGIESPSYDAAAVNRMADRVQHDMGSIGAHMERIPGVDGFGDLLKARTPWGGDGPGILGRSGRRPGGSPGQDEVQRRTTHNRRDHRPKATTARPIVVATGKRL